MHNFDFFLMIFFRQVEVRDAHLKLCLDWKDFVALLDGKNLLLSPFCGLPECEEKIKADSAREEPGEAGTSAMGAKSLCIPLEQVNMFKN